MNTQRVWLNAVSMSVSMTTLDLKQSQCPNKYPCVFRDVSVNLAHIFLLAPGVLASRAAVVLL